MKRTYTILYCLSIILIEPWGNSRGDIWTQPKILVLLLITLLNLSLLWEERLNLIIPRNWKITALLWSLFLSIGFLATLQSPFPHTSLWGQAQMGDGWLYWCLVAGFTLSNALVLKLRPELLRCQYLGLISGGIILAVAIFPQAINWQIDYTATTGQLRQDNILVSTIFRNQQPIGFYSHRGHGAIVLVMVAMSIVSFKNQPRVFKNLTWVFLSMIIIALVLTQTRAAILALTIAITYWCYQTRKASLSITVICLALLLIAAISSQRQIAQLRQFNFNPATIAIKNLCSDRVLLWQQALPAIRERPLLGWGFDGFGIAYADGQTSSLEATILALNEASFDYLEAGQIKRSPLPTYKAHNLILDTTLSVGILGTITYLSLFGYCCYQVKNSSGYGTEAVAIAYFVFTLTWFECAQFSHLAWWTLSNQMTIVIADFDL
ncbi:MAG: O-antigen ligase family protein [Spirulinaceae cyanobacterium]